MGACRVDLAKKSRRLDEDYDLSTPDGVQALILAYNEVHEEAIRSGNYDCVIVLVDLEDAMLNADLSEREREVADLVRRWDIVEVAGVVGIEESSARTYLMRAATKISEYMREGEEWNDGA